MAEQIKTTGATGKAVRATAPAGKTGTATNVEPTATAAAAVANTGVTAAVSTSAEPQVTYGPRLNVLLNVSIVAQAFYDVAASQSVRFIQYVLHERGFEPGNDQGQVDYDTRRAYADFQRSIHEQPTGVPTAHSLNVLGFDVT
jgi:hypothetical protein